MERDLFHILQELKREINVIDLKYLKDKIEVLDVDRMHEEDDFNYYNKQYFKNNIKYLILKIIMLGRCNSRQLNSYINVKNKLEKKLDTIEERYNDLCIEKIVTETLLEINTNKEKSLKSNFNQIYDFLEYIEKIPVDEKDKIFSYKMGA